MRDQATEVEPAVSSLCLLAHVLNDLVAREFSLLNGLVNADHVLPNNSASTNVEMADLRVAHETLGKANSQRRGLELDVASRGCCELIHDRGICGGNGIASGGGFGAGDAPTVNNDYR